VALADIALKILEEMSLQLKVQKRLKQLLSQNPGAIVSSPAS
jgi:hypothetical protein